MDVDNKIVNIVIYINGVFLNIDNFLSSLEEAFDNGWINGFNVSAVISFCFSRITNINKFYETKINKIYIFIYLYIFIIQNKTKFNRF